MDIVNNIRVAVDKLAELRVNQNGVNDKELSDIQMILYKTIDALNEKSVINKILSESEIIKILEEDTPKSELFQELTEKEKIFVMAGARGAARWLRESILTGNYRD